MPAHSLTPPSPSAFSRRSFLRRSALATALAAAGPTVLSACGASPAAGGGGDGPTFLSYLPLETLSMAPELLAVAGGHFGKHGLDVTLQPVKGSPQAMQTLLAGVGPVTRIGQIDVMTAVAESDQPLVNIGTLTRGSSLRFVYSKENPLTKPEDFVGKTMGVPSEGGTSSKVVSLVLANAGLDPSKTPRQVVGLTPGTFNLVQQGRLAGYVVSIDTANIVLSQHEDAAAFDPGTTVRSDSQCYVADRNIVRDDPDTLKAFLAGIQDALAAFVADENFEETLGVLREKYSFATLDDDAIAVQSLTAMRELWTGGDPAAPLLVTDEAEWKAGYDELTAADEAAPGGDSSTWFDNSLLPAAAA
ncbi:nitrate ABC transporter substrate-binding protein [Prauserella marina]|uniref:NitT/TauT family transport system substrate-binding protein n=1 Tax=Prauserella marina TaxID=530584 RepID=A0A222VPR8_9PSEU|nr:ABC transporter substrate-binding protein [Prauserella marina]ASR35919.1 nitrate ABC transporter substrate-binding protein [Prauserella marina]PWV84155.1 NitT/TauT family transport system substrate-binding protein [Prauserella marina]SDC29171.1 NitT/TauT family transport system substrate-binding protein [Prauserella marina]